ncbi:MAG TPA: hydroxymethylglutaryl-CoA lyase [Saprospiraceae bacterium]|nr:hydroxymethylglutaryl-CoA lyase [Saprospiraceae bacterium]HMP22913.1 hydroxymethylglutaryl-CoA lyase [Saprospiraceae bacterium]
MKHSMINDAFGNSTVTLEEQGLRDGLQTLPMTIPTEQKLRWIDQLVAAGLKRLQVASFVHPRIVPQMADADELCRRLSRQKSVIYSALVINLRGVERALACGMGHLAISLSASDTHSQKNARMTLEEAQVSFREMVRIARAQGITVRGGIQCAFGCRYEGHIPPARVLDLVKHHLDTGVEELALADSTGMGNPAALQELMAQVLELAGDRPVALHLHNTENKGLANVYAALQAGVRHFDTAFGGLGGCPFIKSATGNIATEDTAHLLHQMGLATGIDIEQVAQVSLEMEAMLGAPLPGMLYRLLQEKGVKMV